MIINTAAQYTLSAIRILCHFEKTLHRCFQVNKVHLKQKSSTQRKLEADTAKVETGRLEYFLFARWKEFVFTFKTVSDLTVCRRSQLRMSFAEAR